MQTETNPRTRRGSLVPGTAQQLVRNALPPGTRLTAKELRAATGMPRRTLYTVLKELQQSGIVASRDSLRDARQRVYWLTTS